MAVIQEDDNTQNTSPGRGISKKLDLLDQKMDSLYKDIYITRPDNRHNLDDIIDSLDTAIDKLQSTDVTVGGMTELLRRLDKGANSSNVEKYVNSVQELFANNSLIGTLAMNEDVHKFISAENYTYEMICRYLPKLLDAIEIKRDNVLCSDNFSKHFINPKSVRNTKSEVVKFSSNCKRIENEYDFQKFIEKTYNNVSIYGEDFIYVIPYNVAYERIFNRDNLNRSNNMNSINIFESYVEDKSSTIDEKLLETEDWKQYIKSLKEDPNNMMSDEQIDEMAKSISGVGNVHIHINHSNMLKNQVSEMVKITENKFLKENLSLSSMHESMVLENGGETYSISEDGFGNKKFSDMFSKIKDNNMKLPKNMTSADGLIIPNLDRDPAKIDKDINGAVVERLPRENILPIYMGKRCVGYYYFEFAEDPNACGFCGGHHAVPGISNGNKMAYNMTENQQELVVRYIASRISRAIDVNFINNNKDLKEDIYAILNYNSKFNILRSNNVGVTFIPASDIIHCYFELDWDKHRGISDLSKSLVPAMLYILLYLTDIITKVTRTPDKRVYYVKQNVEQNIARTLMNVVGQIKKGNMGMRQIESMNNILNIVGKYNDFIIPEGPSGDPPIRIETIPGQDIQSPTEIMDKMEEAAINPVLPIEFVNSSMQQDFAIRYTMSNTRFVKSIYTRQRDTERWISKIFTKIYNYEFNESNSKITVMLPPPTFLTAQNNSQLLDNISQLCDKIVDTQMANESEEVKMEFKKIYIRDMLSTYIDYDNIDRMLELAKLNIEADKEPAASEEEMGPEDMNDDL